MLTLLTGLLLSLTPQEPRAVAPLRVLVITGGGFHDFDGNTDLLLAGLQPLVPLEVTRLRLVADGQKPQKGEFTPPSKLLNGEMTSRFDAVLQYTQGEVLGLGNDDRDSLLHFVRAGGGFVGLHCAADTMKWNRDFIEMVGGRFQSHPPFGLFKARRILGDHPVLAGIADLDVKDEFYYLDACRLDDKSVLLSGEGPTDGKARPLAWTKSYGDGRVFCTVLGHGPETHGLAAFQQLIANGLKWVVERPFWARGKDGWRTLFDGASLAGWTMSGPGKFSVQNGELATEGGMGLLWFSELALRDFELECEWKLSKPDDNSGVFVRFPSPRTPWDAVEKGYEVQICDAAQGAQATGAIYSFQPPERAASKPVGQWNQYHIKVVGQRYEVTLNRVLVTRYEGSRSLAGFVGLQNHENGQVVRFRNLRAREL